jgi:ankyrin repeat protein
MKLSADEIGEENLSDLATVLSGDNETALHVAVDRGHLDIVEYLVENELVNVEETDKDGQTAEALALSDGSKDIARYLQRKEKEKVPQVESFALPGPLPSVVPPKAFSSSLVPKRAGRTGYRQKF